MLLTLGDKVHLSLLKLCYGSFETEPWVFSLVWGISIYIRSLAMTAHNVFCIVCKTHTIFTSSPFLLNVLDSPLNRQILIDLA